MFCICPFGLIYLFQYDKIDNHVLLILSFGFFVKFCSFKD